MNLLALGALAGLLIWAKLRLVTDFPRIVQADPERSDASPEPDPQVQTPPTRSGREASPPDLRD